VGNDDFGRLARDTLGRESLALDQVKVIDDAATGIALIVINHAGENQIAVAGGANQNLLAADIDALPDELFANAGILLVCLESPLATVTAGLRRARAAGATTILNPAPACGSLVDSGLFALVDVITPNAHEAEALTGIAVRDVGSAGDAGNALVSQGCGAAIVTLGADGAVVVESGSATHVATPPVHAVDTTAAGDCFNGALAVALWEGHTLVEAAQFASRAAAISVSRLGAQTSLPTRGEIDGT
jgi:ribokinase